ncbi:hypothetical protein U1Q18_009019 [Sarracenia purpurea var. burkii]
MSRVTCLSLPTNVFVTKNLVGREEEIHGVTEEDMRRQPAILCLGEREGVGSFGANPKPPSKRARNLPSTPRGQFTKQTGQPAAQEVGGMGPT